MAATRTQIYLTEEQRQRLDLLRSETGASLAELIRLAVDEYLERDTVDVSAILEATFGAAPNAVAPPREEWDRPSGQWDG